MKAEVEFVEFGKNDLKGYTLIEGYPGMGLVGTIAAKYLAEKKSFEYIGYIDSNLFMPVIRIHEGMPVRPARIYADRKKKVAIVISEQVFPKAGIEIVAKKTVEWMKKKGIRELISLSGVNTHSTSKRELIYGIAANEASKQLVKKYDLIEIADGITTGITSPILLDLRQSDMRAISILADVHLNADYKAAAEVLRKLNDVLALEIDVQPLLDEAREAERALLQQLQSLQEPKDSSEKFENKTPLIT